MKVIAFYGGYLPGKKYGGPVTSLYNFTELLGDGMEIYLVCSNHDLHEKAPYQNIRSGWNRVGKARVRYLKDCEMTAETYASIIDEISPDLIYISSLFSASFNTKIYSAAKRAGIPILLAPRGELNKNALSRKAVKKKLYLLYLRVSRLLSSVSFQATSEEEYNDIIRELHAASEEVFLLPNIPAVPRKKPSLNKEAGQLRLCFVGRIVQNKNLLVCLRSLRHVKTKTSFDIYGSKEDPEYWRRCEDAILELPHNITVKYCGILDQTAMRERYTYYDCLISPTQFENYGQSIVESMLSDTPVIISRNTTPWNDIESYQGGAVVDLSDEDGFTAAIDWIGGMDTTEYSWLVANLRRYSADRFDFEQLKKEYCNTFAAIQQRRILTGKEMVT